MVKDMSFSSDVKKELCKIEAPKDCCIHAELYGLLLFSKNFSLRDISLSTENQAVAEKYTQLISQYLGVIVEKAVRYTHRKDKKGGFLVSLPDETDRKQVLRRFHHRPGEYDFHLQRKNVPGKCCAHAFLRGVFLACGAVTDPSKEYHLEFSTPHQALAADLCRFLQEKRELFIHPKRIERKGVFVVYIKGSEHIADLLTYLGAKSAAMDLMQVKMVKEVRNYVNRTTNFETANLTKTATAAASQLKAIERIGKTMGLQALPDELYEVALLRLQNPEMSLREMGERLSEPISRSGVNHRLQKLIEISRHCAPEKEKEKEK